MARARNIKPAFFTNDELAEIPPLGRLLFIGLWNIADYKGCIEWREKRVKAQILPYDNCDIKKLAINLDKSGFIRYYSDSEKVYLKVVNFSVHQNPHKNERIKGSDIPDYSDDMRQLIDLKELAINRDKSGLKRNDSHTDRADSLILIPDSFNPIEAQSRFLDWYEIYPLKKSKSKAEQSWNSQKLDKRADELISILKNQIENDGQWREGIGIPHPSTYLNQQRWNAEIAPMSKSKPEWAKIPRDDDSMWQWAKNNGFHGPGQMTYAQYRQSLNLAVEKRLNGG